MARRDRRRGGAHSASRGGASEPAGGPADPAEPADAVPADAEPAPAGAAAMVGTGVGSVPDTGVTLTRKEARAAAPTAGKKKRRKRARSKHPWLDRALLAGMVVVVLGLVAIGFSYFYVGYRFSQVTKVVVPHLTRAPVGQPFNVLLIGSDSRADIPASQAVHYGDEEDAGGQRSDVVKIVHVVPATGGVSVLSIPRDTMVTVAGNTEDIGQYNRINATYNTGPDQLVQTIEANFGIPIEHVVQINFEGFVGAVNAIGGINLDFPFPAKDTYTGLDITQAGCQHLNGGYALAVARSRHYQYFEDGYWQYDGTSDFGRIQRQNAFLRALINQAETQYSPLTLNAFIGSVVQGVTIDSTFTISELVSLARQFHTFSSASLATATLPTYSEYSSEFSQLGDVLYVQQPQAEQVITQFLGGIPDTATTPPPGPDGEPTPVPSVTPSTVAPAGSTPTSEGSTPSTEAPTVTTTTIQTNFDPTPC